MVKITMIYIIANTQKSKNNDRKIQNNKILFNKVEYQVHPNIKDHAASKSYLDLKSQIWKVAFFETIELSP